MNNYEKGGRLRMMLAFVLALCAGLSLSGCGGPSGANHAASEVAVITVQPSKIELTSELPGRTSAYLVAEIRPQVSGIIQKRIFTEGSDVKSGQVLYQIDPAPFDAALENAQAALGRSQASVPALQLRVKRFQGAIADGAVSQQDLDDATAALGQALADVRYWKAMVETARINLAYARIVSPISGRIGKSTVTDGAIVTAYQPTPLAVIQQLDPIYVDVLQSTTDLLSLRRRLDEQKITRDDMGADTVTLILSDGTSYPQPGTLQFRDISVDPTTASVTLRMVFPNPNGVLLPGMFVRAIVKEGANPHALLVPQQAVSRDPKGKPYALLVGADGKVEYRALSVERALGDRWIVSSGLAPGDKVIVEGMQRARPGTVVKAAPFAEDRKQTQPAQAPSSAP